MSNVIEVMNYGKKFDDAVIHDSSIDSKAELTDIIDIESACESSIEDKSLYDADGKKASSKIDGLLAPNKHDALNENLQINECNNRPKDSSLRHKRRIRGDKRRERRDKISSKSDMKFGEPKDVIMKNAVMMLNEMYPPPSAPQYRVISMTGTPNNPTFTMSCTLLDKTYCGSGKSKKEAKLSASQKVLEEMFDVDFSNGSKGQKSSNIPRSISEIDSWLELEAKNPVSILNELYPGVIFQLVSTDGPSHAPEFCVKATLAAVSYEGRGTSKKEAKLNASKALLVHIHRVGFDPMTGIMKSGADGEPDTGRAEEHSWADRIGCLVRDKYSELFDGTTYNKRKVMAGVVMAKGSDLSVVCVSSGTKCVNGEEICLGGSSLNDCHAEVVARRCLMSWLYGQLKSVLLCEESILMNDIEGGFCLQPEITLHLFISTAPCGDARIFSLHEQPANGSNCLSGYAGVVGEGNRGKLRTKIESGMGTVPLAEEKQTQTWDGVMSGERLMTMACSDKILRWNVLGVQGSLLSHWLRPIYFDSITVGSRFHPVHVRRALFGRISDNFSFKLPKNYKINKPPLLATTSPETRQPSKAQEYSLNWITGSSPEVVVGSTGKTMSGEPSRLCKRSLAKYFVVICSIPGSLDLSKKSLPIDDVMSVTRYSYGGLKSLATDYSEAKVLLVRELVAIDAGYWVEKPVEQDEFVVDLWRSPTIATSFGTVWLLLLSWNFTSGTLVFCP